MVISEQNKLKEFHISDANGMSLHHLSEEDINWYLSKASFLLGHFITVAQPIS